MSCLLLHVHLAFIKLKGTSYVTPRFLCGQCQVRRYVMRSSLLVSSAAIVLMASSGLATTDHPGRAASKAGPQRNKIARQLHRRREGKEPSSGMKSTHSEENSGMKSTQSEKNTDAQSKQKEEKSGMKSTQSKKNRVRRRAKAPGKLTVVKIRRAWERRAISNAART